MTASDSLGSQFEHTYNQDENSHVISHPKGMIDYTVRSPGVNEIWGAESQEPGMGSKLVDQMLKQHPAHDIHWGEVTDSGKGLMQKTARRYPDIHHHTAEDY